ncbi:MAG: MFS transporter, partial [Candidatus Hermodarchaeota archaeon]
RNFRNFNFSWNFGFILGLIVGFIWSYFWSDYLSMIISWSLSFLLIPISFFINKDSKVSVQKDELEIHLEHPIYEEDFKMISQKNSNPSMMVFPILFSWIGIFFLATTKSIFLFTYPVFLKQITSETQTTYLVQGGIQLTQLIGLTWINVMSTNKRKISGLISLVTITLISFTLFWFDNIWYIAVIFSISGLFLGLIHGTSMKIMLDYGTAKNTTKYSTINEILIGIGFGVTPIIAGYVVEVSLYAVFPFIIISGIGFFIIQIYLSRNVKKK